jgi:hypothetical protein
VNYFVEKGTPQAWNKVAALRNHYPVIFSNGKCRLGGLPYSLYLTREGGLEIQKESL